MNEFDWRALNECDALNDPDEPPADGRREPPPDEPPPDGRREPPPDEPPAEPSETKAALGLSHTLDIIRVNGAVTCRERLVERSRLLLVVWGAAAPAVCRAAVHVCISGAQPAGSVGTDGRRTRPSRKGMGASPCRASPGRGAHPTHAAYAVLACRAAGGSLTAAPPTLGAPLKRWGWTRRCERSR